MSRYRVALIPAFAAACFSPTDFDNETDAVTGSTGGTDSATNPTATNPTTTNPSTTDDTESSPTELTGATNPMDSSSTDPDTSGDTTGPTPENCGNGAMDDGEECDDSNTESGDGCSAACVDETIFCDTALVGGMGFNYAGRMVARDGYVYSVPGFGTNATGSLRVVDATNPVAPANAGNIMLDANDYPNWRARGIALSDDHIWVAGEGPEFLSFDLVDPAAPAVDDLDGPNVTDGHIAIQDNLMIIPESVGDQARIYDISDPSSAMAISFVGSSVEYNATLHGQWAIAWGLAGTEVYDITVPSVPELVGLVDSPATNVQRVLANDETIFLVGYDGVEVIDYSQPDLPQVVAGDYPTEYMTDAWLIDPFLYLPVTNGLEVYDITDPEAPILAGSYLQIEAYTGGFALDPPYAYISTDDGLRIVEELPGLCEARCGNNVVEYPEACDDGNLVADDGCNACTR